MKNVVIMDLDGTLACGKHRLHLLPTKDHHITASWLEFNKACINDAPLQDTIDMMRALKKAGKTIYIVTGRSDDAWFETHAWFSKVGIYRNQYDSMIMRDRNDNRKDTVIKEEILRRIGLDNILCCFDDSPTVIEHFRSLGLTVYDVASHNDVSARADLQSHGE